MHVSAIARLTSNFTTKSKTATQKYASKIQEEMRKGGLEVTVLLVLVIV